MTFRRLEDTVYETIESDPAKFGLEILWSHDCGDSCEFDTAIIFRRKTDGALLWATDSGCSCPIPFEGQKAEELEPLSRDLVRLWFKDDHRTDIAAEQKALNLCPVDSTKQ